jgi:hypothetical protein
MGRYDDISPEELRADLRRFAEFLLRLDRDDQLLEATPRVLKLLGELRAKLFAYEVRVTGRLAPEPEPPEVAEAQRIVDDALRRAREAEREWGEGGRDEEEER